MPLYALITALSYASTPGCKVQPSLAEKRPRSTKLNINYASSGQLVQHNSSTNMPEVRFSPIQRTISTRSSLTCKVLLRSVRVPTEGIVPEAPTEAGRARPEAVPQAEPKGTTRARGLPLTSFNLP